MRTITLASPEDWATLLDKYCTCESSDIFPDNHKDRCGYRKLHDEWEQEYLRQLPYLKAK